MNKPLRLSHPLIKIINNSLIDLPAPTNISFWWNFGSLLGLCLVIQIVTGLFLAMHYTSNIEMAFSSVVHICRDVNNGWIIRTLHANGASMFFICIYLHVGRGIYYGSYMYMHTWMIGTVILFLVMTSNKNMMMNESSIKYFIVQAMASTMLLFSILLIQMKYPMGWETEFIPSMMISSSLLLKIGAAPFHFWFPEVMGASSWNNCLTLMTWQKIAPMMVLSYCIQLSTFIWTIIILSIIIGAMGGLNQTSLRQLLAYSSISHLIMLIMMM